MSAQLDLFSVIPAGPPASFRAVPVKAHERRVRGAAKPALAVPFVKGSETSREAARLVTKEKKDNQESAVLRLLMRHPGGLTDEQIGQRLVASMQASSARRARIMLTKAGKVRSSGRKRLAASGVMVTVWEVNAWEAVE